MELITLLQAAFLGVVEGLTEFLPVSSTGHLILMDEILGFKGPSGKVFEIVIQLGAILSVCVLYYKRLSNVIFTLPKNKESQRFVKALIVAFLPAMVLGGLLHNFIKSVLFSPYVVCVSLIIGGVLIILIERMNVKPKIKQIESMPLKLALYIGFGQALAMIPGVSRSGATIMTAILLQVERKTAAEFSFFLAIPTMFAATVYDLYKNYHSLTSDGVEVIAIGFIFAFVSALLVVKWFIGFVSRHGFIPFAYYRIVVGSLMLAILLAR